jgi:hypothetical protein
MIFFFPRQKSEVISISKIAMHTCTEGEAFLKILLFLDIQIAQHMRIMTSMKNGLLSFFFERTGGAEEPLLKFIKTTQEVAKQNKQVQNKANKS